MDRAVIRRFLAAQLWLLAAIARGRGLDLKGYVGSASVARVLAWARGAVPAPYLGYARSVRLFAWFRRHARGVEIAGGTVLVVMGVLMITGAWLQLFTPVLRWYAQKGVAARTNSRRLRDLVVRSAGS